MSGFGVREVSRQGRVLRACAVPPPPYKTGGVTIDWGLVTPITVTPKTLTDDRIVPVGDKYLRYGQVICKVGANAVHTVTVDATSGNFRLTVAVNGAAGQQTANIAENAAAATVQAALEALSNVAPGDVVVTGSAGGPFTLTWGGALAQAAIVVTGQNVDLAGGTATVTVATTAQGSITPGKFGPYDAAAIDGRQLLTRGNAFICDETTIMNIDPKSDHIPGGVFDGAGAYVFAARVLNNANDLTTNPTRSQLETAFPGIRWVED